MAPTGPTIFQRLASLSDATRARLLRLVEKQELTVAELCLILQLPQSTVSRHLKLLSEDGWIQSRREGTNRLYRFAKESMDATTRRLWGLIRDQTAADPTAQEDDRRLSRVLADRQSRSKQFFASAADRWDRLREELFGRRFDLLALPGLLDDRWVMGDLGCGTGQFTEAVAPFVEKVYAVDSTEAMLGSAKQRVGAFENVEIRRGDLEALPLDDASLDAASIGLVLHHIPEPRRAIEEARRVLRPGGRLLIVDMLPHDRREFQQEMGHHWLGFGKDQVEGWFAAAGFERTRFCPLPPEREAKGPGLFAASAARSRAPEPVEAHGN